MSEWTSRKRIEASLRHEVPDRVPLDFAITLKAYVGLREYLGLPVEHITVLWSPMGGSLPAPVTLSRLMYRLKTSPPCAKL
jgi:hypothetical protein